VTGPGYTLRVRRGGFALLFLVACAAAGLLSALLAATPSAIANVGTETTGTTTTGTTTTEPPPPPPTTTTTTTTTAPAPSTIAAGVTIGRHVLVGGLSPAEATLAVREFFSQPLTIRAGRTTLRVTPKQLGAAAYVGEAVKRARITRPGGNVALKVRAPRGRAELYVARLAKRFDRPVVDARLRLLNAKPVVTKERVGRRTKRVLASRALVRSLKTHTRAPIDLGFDILQPQVTRKSIGDVIVIRRGANRLDFYDGTRLRRTFGVATGQTQYPTPLGEFEIVVMWRNPWWYPPASDWARDAKPIPPGPGNPLGTRWMGISSPAVGIHGTPDAASIGYSASHGCIRMRIPDAEWLFEQVELGTPVFIVR
jgi:lipoprotein-anchoring transpeptidase ErfK/SrfK